ncbi:MFS transporter [Streptomyces spectabilis]|uniref:MFS family permease n=1 Tax=Streptomyces spectabilis TaxID=68270 RepID=A0A5P2X4W5_STRST|nr:MFS transporter [Streptomyces spectabilis]MBB5101602.1 MFS family permease [Streptomyces spectabilis]MCI3900785.1 MFS transporter [Streptomyces spectabilis]QEV58319.1 MFS transporter [Streptomyces spectabilis]GGV12438.1 MFS transporter [Streptomyces spectabilis]
MSHAQHTAGSRPSGQTSVVLVLGLAAMVVSMMQTLVVPILSIIQNDLDATTANVSWVTTATLLSAAVFTPLLGRFGDQHGKKPTLIGVLLVMIAGSVLAATTTSLTWLIVGRVMQGAATAIFPLALSVLREEIRPEKLHGAMALVSGTLAFGSGLALVGAGLLTQGDDPDYHRVFWLAVVLAVVALIGVIFVVPASRSKTGGRTDWLGALTLALLLVLLLLPISQGHEWGWTSGRTLGSFAGAVVMAGVWVLTESRVREPMVDMKMFTHRPVLFTNLAGLLLGFAMFAQFIGVSYLVQMPEDVAGYGFGASVLGASVVYLLPTTLVSLVGAQFGGVLVRRIGARVTLAVGAAFGVLGFAWLTLAHDTSASVIGAGMVVGLAISFGYASMPALIVASVPAHQTGIANGINSISRSVGSAIASAMITTLLASKTIELPAGMPSLPQESQFTLSFAIAGAAFLLVVAVAIGGLRAAHAPRASAVTKVAESDAESKAPERAAV